MQILLKESDGVQVGKEWQGEAGRAYVIIMPPSSASVTAPLVPFTKTITTAGTAVRIAASSTPCRKVWLQADLGNTNPVVIGDSTVVAANGSIKGIILIPGSAPVVIDMDDLNKLWVDAQTSGDEVCGAYLV